MDLVRPNAIYSLYDVTFRYGSDPVLDHVSLSIEAGERVAIMGSSGAGKSTLLSLLNGALRPTEGELWLLGYRHHGLPRKRLQKIQAQIGTIYQQFQLIESLRVIHNVNAGHLARWPLWKALCSLVWPLDLPTAKAALEQVGLPEYLFHPTHQLSGGQQQRVAIARILIQNPQVILADEPVSSLDPRLSQEIVALLVSISRAQSKTLIMSLHDVALAQQYCDRMIGLKAGSIYFDGPTASITETMLTELYQGQEP